MGNAQKPTTRTRHIHIKYFSLCEWVECNLMLLERIDTSINMSDHMTKGLQTTLFHCHADFILGHLPPMYSPVYDSIIGRYTNHTVDIISFRLPSLLPLPWLLLAFMLPSCLIINTTHGLTSLGMDSSIHYFLHLHTLFVHALYSIVDCGGVTLDRLVDT
jgi:hypothetical protein